MKDERPFKRLFSPHALVLSPGYGSAVDRIIDYHVEREGRGAPERDRSGGPAEFRVVADCRTPRLIIDAVLDAECGGWMLRDTG